MGGVIGDASEPADSVASISGRRLWSAEEPIDVLGAVGDYRQEVVVDAAHAGRLNRLLDEHVSPLLATCLLLVGTNSAAGADTVQVILDDVAVGHLPAADAVTYAPALKRLQKAGRVAAVPVMVTRWDESDLRPRLWVDLGPADWLFAANGMPDENRGEVLPQGSMFDVGDVSAATVGRLLRQYTGQAQGGVLLFAEPRPTAGPVGALQLTIDGQDVGTLHPEQAAQLRPQLAWCEAKGKIPVVATLVEAADGQHHVTVLAQTADNLNPAWYYR